jgi:membrane protease YdiL (CAAX protease family)
VTSIAIPYCITLAVDTAGHPDQGDAQSVLVAPLVLGEELGWRGYLQLRLFPAQPFLAALATGLIWGVWHYPLILSRGEPTSSIKLTLITLPVATMTLSVFLGWIKSVTAAVWATSLAHASNNTSNHSLQRLGLGGRQDATLPNFAIVPSLVGEALTWGILGGAHSLLRSHTLHKDEHDRGEDVNATARHPGITTR